MMNIKSEKRNRVSYTFLRLLMKMMELDKRTRYYGTDQPLHEAEIHMIKSIKGNEGIHVTGLADMLGVTKGAVSQIIMKLKRKGMIVKDADPANLSRLALRLTSKGEIAHMNHEMLHQKYDQLFNDILADASEAEKAFLKYFLNRLEHKIDTFEEK